jgi:hypothetical protein
VTSAGAKRRKARTLREEAVVDDAVVVLRAAAAGRPRTIRNAVEDAVDSGATYVVVRSDGRREMLFGISVFAQREGREVADVLRLFPHSPSFLRLTIGDIRRAGFEVLPTGSNPDHYDVQLISGRVEGVDVDAGREELRSAAARLLLAAGDLEPNPAYAGETSDRPEDER